MNLITKVSEITVYDVADYIRLDEMDSSEQNTIQTILEVAKTYVKKYTGRTDAELDESQDFVIAVLVLCQDMYDNRALYLTGAMQNKVVDSILSLHSCNLL